MNRTCPPSTLLYLAVTAALFGCQGATPYLTLEIDAGAKRDFSARTDGGADCVGDPDKPGGVSCAKPGPPGSGQWVKCRPGEFSADCDPCAGQVASSTTNAQDQILFYAPSNYHYGINKYAKAVEAELTAAGYKVTLVTSVQDGVKFDECNLYLSFKQIWLFMPCNNHQTMDNQSFAALKKYYQWGSALVLLTDNHYFTQNNPNTHCSQTSFAGEAGSKVSDAVRIAKEILQINVAYGSYNPTPPQAVNAKHPLASAVSSLTSGVTWTYLQIDEMGNRDVEFLPITYGSGSSAKSGKWAAVIEVSKPDQVSNALVLSPLYCYHCTIPTASNALAMYRAIANHYELRVTESRRKLTGQTTGGGTGNNTFDNRARAAQQQGSHLALESAGKLWVDLFEADKHKVARALVALADRDAIDFDTLYSYLGHPSYFVRHHAVLAISLLPREGAVKRLRQALSQEDDQLLLMGIARALSAHNAGEAAPDLLAALRRPLHEKAHRELIDALAGLRASAALPLLHKIAATSRSPMLRAASSRALAAFN
ncbi:MAG: HEAT repeat domain-containing protein [Deltaproteobacteria bacterium]|nr:HEAT repeat domain-containing protein [Deltaproteobacteria bacterium]